MREIKVKLYKYDELSERSKEKACDWYYQFALDYEWWDSVYDDATNIGLKITEFDLGRAQMCRGQFTGDALECAEKIKKNHGDKCDTYKTAVAFLEERDKIVEQAERDKNGDFVNEYELDQKLDKCEEEFLHALLEDYRVMLQNEIDHLTSREAIEESIIANGYEFTEGGKIQ